MQQQPSPPHQQVPQQQQGQQQAPLLHHPMQPPHPMHPHAHMQQQQQQQAPLLPHPQQGGHPQQFAQGPPPPGMQAPFHPQQQQFAPPPHHPQQFQPGPPPPHLMHPHPQMMQQQGPHSHPHPHPQQAQQQHSHHSMSSGGEQDPFLSHVVSASLVDLLGKQILVLLRDGRKLIGELLSFDQYSNIVLSNTSERKVLGSSYYDEPLGLYVIRGENVVLLGDQHPNRLSKHSPPVEFNAVSKAEFAALEEADKKKREELGIKSVKSSAVRGEEDDLQ